MNIDRSIINEARIRRTIAGVAARRKAQDRVWCVCVSSPPTGRPLAPRLAVRIKRGGMARIVVDKRRPPTQAVVVAAARLLRRGFSVAMRRRTAQVDVDV